MKRAEPDSNRSINEMPDLNEERQGADLAQAGRQSEVQGDIRVATPTIRPAPGEMRPPGLFPSPPVPAAQAGMTLHNPYPVQLASVRSSNNLPHLNEDGQGAYPTHAGQQGGVQGDVRVTAPTIRTELGGMRPQGSTFKAPSAAPVLAVPAEKSPPIPSLMSQIDAVGLEALSRISAPKPLGMPAHMPPMAPRAIGNPAPLAFKPAQGRDSSMPAPVNRDLALPPALSGAAVPAGAGPDLLPDKVLNEAVTQAMKSWGFWRKACEELPGKKLEQYGIAILRQIDALGFPNNYAYKGHALEVLRAIGTQACLVDSPRARFLVRLLASLHLNDLLAEVLKNEAVRKFLFDVTAPEVTPLHVAIDSFNSNAARMILNCDDERGTLRMQRSPDGQVALHLAVATENHDMVELLLSRVGSEQRLVNGKPGLALHTAANGGAGSATVRKLLEDCPTEQLICQNRATHTPLMTAVLRRDIETVRLLLAVKPALAQQLTMRSADRRTVYDIAKSSGNAAIISLLDAAMKELPPSLANLSSASVSSASASSSSLAIAGRQQREEALVPQTPAPSYPSDKDLSAHGNSSMNETGSYSRQGKRFKVTHAPVNTVQGIAGSGRPSQKSLNRTVDAYQPQKALGNGRCDSETYSHNLQQSELESSVANLVPDPGLWLSAYEKKGTGERLAFLAESMKQIMSQQLPRIFEYVATLEPLCDENCLSLLQHQAWPNGRTLASVLVELQLNAALAKVLKAESGKNSLSLVCDRGYSLLHYAALSGNAEAAKLILNTYGPASDIRTKIPQCLSLPLHSAADRGALKVAKLLLQQQGEDQRLTANSGQELPIHRAIIHGGRVEIVRLLLDEKALEQVTMPADALKQTALMIAVYYRAVEVVELLLSLPDLVEIQLAMRDVTGKNAFDIAKAQREAELVEPETDVSDSSKITERYAMDGDALIGKSNEPPAQPFLEKKAEITHPRSAKKIMDLIEGAIARLPKGAQTEIQKGRVVPAMTVHTNLNDMDQEEEGMEIGPDAERMTVIKFVDSSFAPMQSALRYDPHSWFAYFLRMRLHDKVNFCAQSMYALARTGGFDRFACKGVLVRACRIVGMENLMRCTWPNDASLVSTLTALHLNEQLAEILQTKEGKESLFLKFSRISKSVEKSTGKHPSPNPASHSYSDYTALHDAVAYRNVKAVKLILRHDPENILLDVKTENGILPIDLAKCMGAQNIVALLEQADSARQRKTRSKEEERQ